MPFVCHTTIQQHLNHNHHKHFTTNKEHIENLPELNTLWSVLLTFFFELAKGWRVGKHCCTVWQETTLNNMMRVKTDILNCNSGPGSIQCTRTSFLASFTSSCPASKKNISFFLIGVNDTVFLKSCYRDMSYSFYV